MRHALQVGFSFGLTSGIITTLGLIVGLAAGTQSRLAVIGGVLTIAIADAMSDALGIHISEEAENVHTPLQIWTATGSTFLAKLLMALSFLAPVTLLPLVDAVVVSVAWGGSMLVLISWLVARSQRIKPLHVIVEHVGIAALVVAVTHYLGVWTATTFA